MRDGQAEIAVGSDRAPRGRPGARDPRAGQGGRAPPGSAKEVTDRMRRHRPRSHSARRARRVRRRCARTGSRSARQLSIVRVASGLTRAGRVTAPKNEPNNVYVVEKVGRVRVIVEGRLRARPFLDIRSLVLDGGEQGMLGLAFSPNYAKNRHFYVDYTDRNGDARIVEYKSRGLNRKPREAAPDLLPEGSVREPQRRATSSSGPDGYLYTGHRRRRLRRRPREPRAEPALDLRQAPAVQRREEAAVAR